MADAFLTLTDLAKVNDEDNMDFGISDILDEAPLIAKLAADDTSGDTHKYIKQTGAPTVGYRAVNTGRENSKSTDSEVTVTLKLLDCSVTIDQAIADQFKHGRDAYVKREAMRHLRAGFSKSEIQIFYGTGTGGDAAGHAGLADNSGLDALADAMVIGAGGVAANVQTSVWAIRTGSDFKDMALILGQDGNISMGETISQAIEGATGRFPGYYTPIQAWLGVQIGGAFSVGRLCNVDATATLDDDMIADLISLFPASRKPNLLVMNGTSLGQLRKSRTATNATGAPAPFPEDAHGIEIVETDSINSTEAVIA